MAGTKNLSILTDLNGNVLAASFETNDKESKNGKNPTASLESRDNQRIHNIAVPAEVLSLSGPSLRAYFSQVRIKSPSEVHLPKIKIVTEKDRGSK
jgi:hypothetical protein